MNNLAVPLFHFNQKEHNTKKMKNHKPPLTYNVEEGHWPPTHDEEEEIKTQSSFCTYATSTTSHIAPISSQ